MAKVKRVYRHYQELEEFHNGMWLIIRGEDRKRLMLAAADLLRDEEAFKRAVSRVVREWPISCETNFTGNTVNHIAWLGQAACCLAAGAPEEATRAAWHGLTLEEQVKANLIATDALLDFWRLYRQPGALDLFAVAGVHYA